MNYFWITQKPQSQKKELENGWIKARPAKIYNHYREMVKTVKEGDVIFFCSRGIINHIGFAVSSVITETDEKGELWRVEFKSHQLENPVEISNHSEYLLDKRAEKYSPITSLGTAHQGYCSEISEVIAWYLLSRAGVYYKNNEIVELDKAVGYRDAKSASYRISNLNTLMSSLSREDILETLDKFSELKYSDYKYQKSTTYDLEYNGNLYPPKVIFGVSAVAIINRVLFADEFSGGLNSPCFNVLNSLGFDVVKKLSLDNKIQEETNDALLEDIEVVVSDPDISVTQRKQLIDARIGQGKYRDDLKKIYGQCLLTGITLDALLRASHIKPWRESSNEERLDPYNGLLLSANIDALFDRGMISFKDNGELIISNSLLNYELMESIGLNPAMKIKLNSKSYKYLEWHRRRYFPYLNV